MEIDLLLLIIITVLNLFLIFLIASKTKKRPDIIFCIIIGFVIIWSISNYLAEIILNYNLAYFLVSLTYAAALLIAILFLNFSAIFPTSNFSPSKKKLLFVNIISIIPFVISFTPLIIGELHIEKPRNSITSGPLISLYLCFFLIIMISSFLILIRKYKNAISIEKLQIRYIFIGTYLSVVGASITNLIIPYITENWRLSRYGPYFTIFLVVFTTYAILKHHLFNLKVIATELLVGLVAIILLIDLLVSKDTSTILFKLAIFTLFAYLGISLIQSVLKEIKRREQMEVMALKLQRAYEDLKQLDKTKTEFLSMASHQLRTPLSAIKGYVSMILEGSYGKLPEKAKQKLKNVFISNERLIDIINDLLDISKAELGKMELNKKSLQIEDLITSVYEEMKIRAEEKHLQFILEKPPVPLPKIEVDELKIRQVISNVVDNALKYTQEGKIEIKVNRTDSIIQVSVADTGAGLTPEEIKAVFGGFARGSAGIDFFIEGTGLGLYVAKKYLELHKGKIWAESEGKGKGSTFYIELPINPVDNGTK